MRQVNGSPPFKNRIRGCLWSSRRTVWLLWEGHHLDDPIQCSKRSVCAYSISFDQRILFVCRPCDFDNLHCKKEVESHTFSVSNFSRIPFNRLWHRHKRVFSFWVLRLHIARYFECEKGFWEDRRGFWNYLMSFWHLSFTMTVRALFQNTQGGFLLYFFINQWNIRHIRWILITNLRGQAALRTIIFLCRASFYQTTTWYWSMEMSNHHFLMLLSNLVDT